MKSWEHSCSLNRVDTAIGESVGDNGLIVSSPGEVIVGCASDAAADWERVAAGRKSRWTSGVRLTSARTSYV